MSGFSLTLERGALTSLLGANGAGKTTAVELMLGLRTPDSGRVLLFGGNPREAHVRRLVGCIPQRVDYPATLRVNEILDVVAAHYPAPMTRAEVLDLTQTGHLAQRQAGGLSGGEARRVALALALLGRPQLLILDAPTTGLDFETRDQVWQAGRFLSRPVGPSCSPPITSKKPSSSRRGSLSSTSAGYWSTTRLRPFAPRSESGV